MPRHLDQQPYVEHGGAAHLAAEAVHGGFARQGSLIPVGCPVLAELAQHLTRLHLTLLHRFMYVCMYVTGEILDSLAFGELRNGAKTKAGPLEAEQLESFR